MNFFVLFYFVLFFNCKASFYLSEGSYLYEDEYLEDKNGNYILKLESNGNLVGYTIADSSIFWESDSFSTGPHFLAMQTDNNLVIYDGSYNAIWASGTGENIYTACNLTLQTDRNIAIWCDDDHKIWSSETAVAITTAVAMPTASHGKISIPFNLFLFFLKFFCLCVVFSHTFECEFEWVIRYVNFRKPLIMKQDILF